MPRFLQKSGVLYFRSIGEAVLYAEQRKKKKSKSKTLKYILPISLLSILLQSASCVNYTVHAPAVAAQKADVILFYPGKNAAYQDIASYKEIANALGLSHRVEDHSFINRRESFFDDSGQRTFKVLILPGGEPYRWFAKTVGDGIDCDGVANILNFIDRGGSVIALCICGPSLFSTDYHWLNPSVEESQQGKWDRTNLGPGWFKRFCGVYAFQGMIRGPQETNRPYPTPRFLPIKMNPEHEIVREAELPSTIYQIVTGGGSIIPYEGQPLEAVGWYQNGTVAIGVVPYGKGRIIMSNPHPNIAGENAVIWALNGVLADSHAKRLGWTDQMIAKERKRIQTEGDPDGAEPDLALAKAMLLYAYRKASQ
jgi:hypothetical protein